MAPSWCEYTTQSQFMILNNIKVAFRNLSKNKISAGINIGGLAIGMAVATLIGLWIMDEVSFDDYHQNYNRLAQVIQNTNNNGETDTWFNVPFPLGDELRKNYGRDIKYLTMSTGTWQHILATDQKKLTSQGVFFEPDAIKMFNFKLLKGSTEALNDPASILLSSSTAEAFFGNENPINKVLKMDNDNNLIVKVTGVFEDLPKNSSFSGLAFISPWKLFVENAGWVKGMEDKWRCNCFFSYLQVAENASMENVSRQIRDAKISKIAKAELIHKPALFLHPMKDWHLKSDFKNGYNVGGRIQLVWLFGIIGVFVLLLACINFMNLSTARSEKRAKEVGIRKAIGSLRSQLVFQFYCESFLVVAMSFFLALLCVQFVLPFFNQVADKNISIPFNNPYFWASGFILCFITGIFSGSYPALYLSSFNPVSVLKGTFKVGRFSTTPRKVLVVLQFTISVILITGTIIVYKQIDFAKSRAVGYNRESLVVLPMVTSDIHKHFDAVKNDLIKTNTLISLAESSSTTTGINGTNSGFDWKGKDPNLAVDFPNTEVSIDYGKTVGWQFKEGRDFSRDFASDSLGFVINESAAKYMGLKNPVGEIVKWDNIQFTVIGVIKDMLVESPYQKVRPGFYHLTKDAGNYVLAKINPALSPSTAMSKIETVFKKYNPEQPFEFQFVDEEYARKFTNEKRIGNLAGFFASLAIFISCLGLFGMASYMAEKRTKEIGVRKILGASVLNLLFLLSREFVSLICISLLIATPVAFLIMHNWLQGYEYRTAISWWIFISAGIGAILITLLTVSYQSIKAALSNPVKSLRTE